MTTALTIDIDDKTHYKFKEFCLKKGISMKDAVHIAISIILRGHVDLDKKKKKK